MTVRIGANPIGWSNDDMQDLGGKTPLEVCLREASSIGFQGMEKGHKFPSEAAAMKAKLAEFGMVFVSGWYSSELLLRSPEDEFAAMRSHLDLHKGNDCKVMVFCETSNAIHGDINKPLSQRPVMKDGDWAEFGARLTSLAGMMLKEGVRLVYHHHMGTIVQSRKDIDALMASTGEAVHLLLDTGHATWGGSDPVDLAKTYKPRISHVHCKDVRLEVMARSKAEDWSFLKSVLEGVYTQPGMGSVDYPAVFKVLNDYSGWCVVEAEQDPDKANPLEYHTKGFAYLDGVLKATGLR